jgi:predicted TIM-barrel fold metal-dependent hydrolase
MFLETASASMLAARLAPGATAETEGAMIEGLYSGEIVDTHLHLWDLKALRLPWVASATGKARDVLAYDHLLSDYAKAAEGLKITRAVYMEVDVAESDQLKEVEYVSKICDSGHSPMKAAVISGRPASSDFSKYLDHLKGNSAIKGLRQVLHTPATEAKFCLEPAFVKGVQLLGERGLSFDLCLRNDQLESGAELVDRCPGTRFILDHCGNPHAGSNDLTAWRKGLSKIAHAKNPHVMVKVSGVYGNVTIEEWPADRLSPVVKAVIDEFGWDRVMFAGDWPVVNLGASLKGWVETLKTIVLDASPTNQSKLFVDNAVKFYGLA